MQVFILVEVDKIGAVCHTVSLALMCCSFTLVFIGIHGWWLKTAFNRQP
jgi:hypothetical protein